MKTYIVQLEDHDDFISTRDKISWSKANRVLLVWPRRGRVLERPVDLLLLQRHSQQIGAQMALVTRSGAVKAAARDLGIPVFREPAQAQRVAWRKPRRHGFQPGERRPADPQTVRAGRAGLPEPLHLSPAQRVGVFTLGVAAFLVLMLVLAPGATVTLQPARQLQRLALAVWAAPEITAPSPAGGLPAQALKVVVEGRDQAAATGQARIPDRFAAGAVTLRNLTAGPVDVPAGSMVISADQPPVRFAVTEAVRVPAGPGQEAQAAVRAELPGSAGNLAAGRIQAMEGPVGLSLTVTNPQATTGGADRTSPAPRAADYRALREKLLASLRASALTELRGQLKPGQRLLEGTLHLAGVTEETREPPEGQPGDRLQLTLRGEYEVWAVTEADLNAVAQAALDANRSPGFRAVPGSLTIRWVSEPELEAPAAQEVAAQEVAAQEVATQEVSEAQGVATQGVATQGVATQEVSEAAQEVATQEVSGATETPSAPDRQPLVGAAQPAARWQIEVTRTLTADWSGAELAGMLRGQTLDAANRLLASRLDLAAPPEITITPFFWKRLPYLPARIHFVTGGGGQP